MVVGSSPTCGTPAMSVPGFNKDYNDNFSAGRCFDVTLKHTAGSEHFYVIVYASTMCNVTTFKNVYDARGMFNKIVKELKKVDKVNRAAADEIAKLLETTGKI